MTMKRTLAKMITTHNGAGRTFQAYGVSAAQREAIKAELSSEVGKQAKAFTRDDHPSLLVVEFWSEDTSAMEAACDHFAKTLNVRLGKGKPSIEELAKVA